MFGKFVKMAAVLMVCLFVLSACAHQQPRRVDAQNSYKTDDTGGLQLETKRVLEENDRLLRELDENAGI